MKDINPIYEVINHKDQASILYVEHGFPHPSVRWHIHKEFEIHLLTHSHGKAFIGDYIGNFYPGNLFFTGPNLPHNWITSTNNDEIYPERDRVIVFDDELIDSANKVFPELEKLNSLFEKSKFGIQFNNKKAISKCSYLMSKVKKSNGIKKLIFFFEILDLLSNETDINLLSSGKSLVLKDNKSEYRINLAVNYIFKNYQNPITRKEVSEIVGMEPTYFSKFFQKATGQKLTDFINSMRITKACDLLLRTDQQVTEISFKVGFSNVSNFNRCFLKLKKITPSKYRQIAAL